MTFHKPDDYWNWNYRCALPQTLTIQLKSSTNDIKLDNVFCVYWISIGADDCFSQHFIPTDSDGKIVLTRKEILHNTTLETYYEENSPFDDFPIRFDFEVQSAARLAEEIKGIERDIAGFAFEEIDKLAPHSRGLDKEFVKHLKHETGIRIEKDKVRLPTLKQNRNQSLNVQEKQYQITESWTEERNYYYELVL